MKTYIVKLKGKNELVGIAAARDVKELIFAVDEVCNPAACEYQEIKGRGGMLFMFTAAEHGKYDLESDECTIDFDGITEGETLYYYLNKVGAWKPICKEVTE